MILVNQDISLAKFIGFITQRSNSVTDEIRMNASIIMGIVSSLDSFIMSYLLIFYLKMRIVFICILRTEALLLLV